MYVKMLKKCRGTRQKETVYDEDVWRILFDGWFPDETDEEKIFELLNSDVPGVYTEEIDGETCLTDILVELSEENGENPVYRRIDGSKTEEKVNRKFARLLKPDYKGEPYEKTENDCLMLVLLPGERPYAAVIRDKLEVLQQAVKGYIEFTYPFADNCIVIGNDEAKLLGMTGNRRINGEIYAGPLLLAGDDYEGGLCDLSFRQVEKYSLMFRDPEEISEKEVEDSIKIEVFMI
ncbi:MAG: DUF3846 domain-containing protein [Clostridia bacterium]|nr:DUF3846 domain-containing protein [Clostridia bacterium]